VRLARAAFNALIIGTSAALLGVSPPPAAAQTGTESGGGVDLLLPTGARAIGMGQAVAAAATGADALWWNPALIVGASRQVGMSIGKLLAISTDAGASVIIPFRRAFTIGVGVRYIDEGEEDATFLDPNAPTGTFDISTVVLAASFAAPFGDRLAAGFTAKVLRVGFACTGACNTNTPRSTPTTQALDLGVQYYIFKDSSLSAGAAVRDAGFRLQINDAPQADPLPTRFEAGLLYRPKFAQLPADQRVLAAADIVTRTSGGGAPGFRIGGEWSWQERVEARLGYVVNGPIASQSGATIGAGFAAGKWQIDVAQLLIDSGGLGGGPPTFISLRYAF
jgi:hypothetical protein